MHVSHYGDGAPGETQDGAHWYKKSGLEEAGRGGSEWEESPQASLSPGKALEDVLYLRQNRLCGFPSVGWETSASGELYAAIPLLAILAAICLPGHKRHSPKERGLHFAEAKEASK